MKLDEKIRIYEENKCNIINYEEQIDVFDILLRSFSEGVYDYMLVEDEEKRGTITSLVKKEIEKCGLSSILACGNFSILERGYKVYNMTLVRKIES